MTELDPIPMSTPPTIAGWYVVWQGFGGPTTCYFSGHAPGFRRGPTRLNATHYFGPLPKAPEEADPWPP